jgi:hypothetical protein
MLSKRQRQTARQKFMQQFKQTNMGNGLDKTYYAEWLGIRCLKTKRKNGL